MSGDFLDRNLGVDAMDFYVNDEVNLWIGTVSREFGLLKGTVANLLRIAYLYGRINKGQIV